MGWFKGDQRKTDIAIVSVVLLLTLLIVVIALVGGGHQVALPSQAPGTGAIQLTPTVDATAVVQDQLKQQDEKLQRENSFPWTILNTSSVGAILLGVAAFASAVIGFSQWRGNRRDEQKKREEEQDRWRKEREEERRKRDEGRFQAVVEGLGSKDIEARVGSAVALRTFLQPGYEQFYKQIFDLACAYLLLRKAAPNADLNVPIALDPLSQALIVVFRESFPYVRESFSEEERSQYPPPYFTATGIQLDNAYLSYADLREAWLREAYLRQAHFWATDLRKANLKRAKLTRANLSRAKLEGADLSGVDLSEANLEGADPEAAKYLNGTIMHRINGLTKEQLKVCKAKGAIIDEDFTIVLPQSPASPSSSSPSNDAQAPSAPPAQENTPTPGTDSAASSVPSSQS